MGFNFNISKSNGFYELLNKEAQITNESAKMILELAKDLTKAKEWSFSIKTNEHRSDSLMQEIAEKLNQSFITPIDREDIYTLASQIDDIMDYIDELSVRFSLYNITEITKDAEDFINNLINITQAVVNLVACVANLKDKNAIDAAAKDIDKYENIADTIYYNAVATLFKENTNPIDILRWEKIYSGFENATNKCKEVANLIHTIIIKHTWFALYVKKR